MRELPRLNIHEDFYLWFNFEEKEEYYATPLYLYNVNRKRIKQNDETRLCLKLEKDISKTKLNKKKEIIRQPSTIYIHYEENLGAMLINFLNADFTNYETAYNTFFYAYGFELVKEYTITVEEEDVEEPDLDDNPVIGDNPTPQEPEESGCSGSVIPTFISLVILLSVTLLLVSKKNSKGALR